MRNLRDGWHAVKTPSLITLVCLSLEYVGKRNHMENYQPRSQLYPILNPFCLILIICRFSLRFAEEHAQAIAYYISLRDSVVDFEADYSKLVSSSRAINKIAKAVCTSFMINLNFLSAYTDTRINLDAYRCCWCPRR